MGMRVLERITTLTLYNNDTSIFDKLLLPSELDRDTVIENILFETQGLNVLYTDPGSLQFFLGVWSKRRCPIWEKLYNTLLYDYNPIENYDRMEESTTTGSNKMTGSETSKKREDGTFTDDITSSNTAKEVHDYKGSMTGKSDTTSSNNTVDSRTLSDNLSHDYSKNGTETRDLKGSNNESRNMSTHTTENRDLHGTNNENRELSTNTTESRDLRGSNNEVRNLSLDETRTNNFTDNASGSETHSGIDTTTHGVTAFNSNTSKQASIDSTTHGHKIDTTNRLEHDGGDNLHSTNTGTDNFSTTDTGTITTKSTNSGTDKFTSSDTGTITTESTNSGTDNFSTTDTGTIKTTGIDSGTDNRNVKEDYTSQTTGTIGTTDTGNTTDIGSKDITGSGSSHSDKTSALTSDSTLGREESGEHEESVKIRAHGNIGVTTTQQMIEQERLVVEFDVIEYIVNDYKRNFCIMVY